VPVAVRYGKRLGDMTNELGSDDYTEFVCGGPKYYAYRNVKARIPERETKARVITRLRVSTSTLTAYGS